MGLNRSSYTVHEDVGILKVCVMVLDSGELGTNLDLQLSTYSGTAQGTCTCMYIHVHTYIYIYVGLI